MSSLIRNLTALRDLKFLEVRAGRATLQIMLYVFIVRGLHRKWKQPVAYYLSCGSTKAEMLLQFLIGVLGACQSVGLHAVCDMGVNNIKAMKLLGSTRSEPFFQFQNEAIAMIYYPPHLLKCTRKLFRKYDVQF
jgi:hypothetical protein